MCLESIPTQQPGWPVWNTKLSIQVPISNILAAPDCPLDETQIPYIIFKASYKLVSAHLPILFLILFSQALWSNFPSLKVTFCFCFLGFCLCCCLCLCNTLPHTLYLPNSHSSFRLKIPMTSFEKHFLAFYILHSLFDFLYLGIMLQ